MMANFQPASSQRITTPNPIVHPAATLLSPKRIEDSNGEFYPWDNLESKNCSIGDTEVVPYGMVLLSTLGEFLRVPTPTHDPLIQLASVMSRTDYWKAGRGMEQLGLSKLDRKGPKQFLLEGRK